MAGGARRPKDLVKDWIGLVSQKLPKMSRMTEKNNKFLEKDLI